MQYIYNILVGCLFMMLLPVTIMAQHHDKECPAYHGVKYTSRGGALLGTGSRSVVDWPEGLKLRIEVGAGKSGRDLDFDMTALMGNVSLVYDVFSWLSAGVGGGIFHDDANTGLAFLTARFYALPNNCRIRPYGDVKAGFGFCQSTRGFDDMYKITNLINGDKYIYSGGYTAGDGEALSSGEKNGMTYKEYVGTTEAETAHQGPMCLLGAGLELRNGLFFGATYSLITGHHKATTRKVWQFEDNTTYIGDPVTSSVSVPSNGWLIHVGWSILLKRKR